MNFKMPFNYLNRLRADDDIDINIVMAEDHDPRKVNASQQCYRTEMGFPWSMPIVKEIEVLMANRMPIDDEELPGFGIKSFRSAVTELVLGTKNIRVVNGQVLTVQSISSVGGLGLIGEIASKQLKLKHVYVPSSTCDGMQLVFRVPGFPKPKTYRYYDNIKHELDMEGMLEDLREIPADSLVVFYSCCHNPTGCDPTLQQWRDIVEAVGMKVFPVVDLSYQGLASGDLGSDAYPVRLFARLGFEMAVSVSFVDNFLLYSDSVGAAMFLTRHQEDIPPLKSHLATIIASMYGRPPYYSAKIVSTVLNSPKYYEQWLGYLNKIRQQIQTARDAFVDALVKFKVPGNWDYISKGKGLSTIINLTDRQVQHLIVYHHVYIRKNGSLNVGALVGDKIDYVAKAIGDCIREYPPSPYLDE